MLGAPGPAARGEDDNRMRCPECGGLNPADAEWCGQCLARFGAPDEPVEAPSGDALETDPEDEFASWLDLLPATERPGAGGPITANDEFDPLTDPFPGDYPVPPTGPLPGRNRSEPFESRAADVVERRAGAFAVAGQRISWTCSRCETDNPLEANVCEVCGTPFAEVVGSSQRAPRIARDPNMTAFVSLFYPGAGHAYIGMWGQAIARAALSSWVVAVAVFAVFAHALPGGLLIGTVFGLAAFALWAVTAHDAFREASDQSDMVILRPRAFLYVTIALLFVLFGSLMMAGLSASRSL